MGIGIEYESYSVDGFNSDTPYPMRFRTAAFGGTDPQFTVPASPTFPNSRAGTPTRYIYEFPGIIDISDLSGSYPIILKDGATTLTRVTGTPNANEYRVVTNADSRARTQVEFDSAQAGNAIDYDWYILGGALPGDELNNLNVETLSARTDGYIIIEDQKPSGTNGGNSVANTWETRDLNTIVSNTAGYANLSSNQITLQPGTYSCYIRVPAARVDLFKSRLYNVTDGSLILEGSNGRAVNSSGEQSDSFVVGVFSLSTTKTLEVQQRGQTAPVSNGFGIAVGGSITVDHETYTQVTIQKLS